MAQLAIGNQQWVDRSRRAGELVRLQPHAEELLMLYLALLEPQLQAYERAQQEQPAARELPAYVAAIVLPGILAATLRAGPDKLRGDAMTRFHEADFSELVSRWLAGGELSATDRYPHGLGNDHDQVGRYLMVQGAPQTAGAQDEANADRL